LKILHCRWSRQQNGSQYWNKRARHFSRSFYGSPTTKFYLEEEKYLIREYFENIACKKILKLDLWNEAQNTEILFWLSIQGSACFGVDISEFTAHKARKRSKDLNVPIHTAVADIVHLPFPDETFDFLYTMGTIEHIPEFDKAISEINRVLKKGGRAVIGVPNKLNPFMFYPISIALQFLGVYPYGYEKCFTNKELAGEIKKSGLNVVGRDGILFLPWVLRFLDLFLWLHYPSLCRITEFLLKPFSYIPRRHRLIKRCGHLTVCIAEKQ